MLPFTAEVLFSSVAAYNRALWPLPALVPALALAGLLLMRRPVRGADRALCALLAAAWLGTGIGWFYLHFARIDFAAQLYAAGFVLEGLLVAWTGVLRGRLALRWRADLAGYVGLALALAAILAWPLADGLSGRGWQSMRLVGLAPGPTALMTLGLLLLSADGAAVRLALIPLLWTMVAGAIAWVLAISQDLALPVVGLGAFGLLLGRSRWRAPG